MTPFILVSTNSLGSDLNGQALPKIIYCCGETFIFDRYLEILPSMLLHSIAP